MYHLPEFFHSKQDEDLLDVDLQMLQALLLISPLSKIYTVSTVLFHKDGGDIFSYKFHVKLFMFVPTKATAKLYNGNIGHTQGVGTILCLFPIWSILYPVEPFIIFQVTLTTPFKQVP